MAYCFDSSSLIECWSRSYPEDVLPGLWTNLSDLIEVGSVRCPEEVRLELKRQDDGLAKWADKQEGLFIPLDAPIQIATAQLLRITRC